MLPSTPYSVIRTPYLAFDSASVLDDDVARPQRDAANHLAAELAAARQHGADGARIGEARPGDVVLLAGKGHERTIERSGGAEEWDEVRVATEVLTSLGYPQHT